MTAAPTAVAEMVDTASLRAWPQNPRKNDGEPVARVADSIRKFGFAAPIVARLATREIIAGHTRWKAAQLLKLAQVPVRFVDLDERQAHLLALADNRLGELAEWDTPELHALLASYDVSDQLVSGWDDKDMRELERAARGDGELEDDDAPEPPINPVTQLGDLWLLGKHRLVCGDATDARAVGLAKAKLEPFLMVTDPPYGVEYDPAWRTDPKFMQAMYEANTNNHCSTPNPKPSKRTGKVLNDDRASWVEAWRLFSGDVAYIWSSSVRSDVMREFDSIGFERRAQLVWRKQQFLIGRGHYHWQHETCWYLVRAGKPAQWSGDRAQSTVWDITSARYESDGNSHHGTQKPVECMARPLRNHGDIGSVVYDPFCGSGTTLVAAEQLGRVCVALELSPAYCDVIVERWQRLTGDKAQRQPG